MPPSPAYIIPHTAFFIKEPHDAANTNASKDTDFDTDSEFEQHYNELYKLFLRRLSHMDAAPEINEEDKKILRHLLDEILTLKSGRV